MFPKVQNADTKSGIVSSNSTSWPLEYPTNIAADDLLFAILSSDGSNAGGGTWPAGWIAQGYTAANAVSLIIAKKKAVGSETGSFNVTGLTSEQGNWRIFRITDWEGTLGTWAPPSAVEISAPNGAANSNPDPRILDPSWEDDTLWCAIEANDHSDTIVSYPSGFMVSRSAQAGGTNGSGLGIAMALGEAISISQAGATARNIYGDGDALGEAVGQSFVIDSSFSLSNCAVYMGIGGTPVDGVIAEIHSDACNGPLLGTSETIYPTGLNYYVFDFVSPISLLTGTTYYLVIRRVGAHDTQNYYRVYVDLNAPYPYGSFFSKTDGYWVEISTIDLGVVFYKPVVSIDPGVFTLSGSEEWVTLTIGIRGLTEAPPEPPVSAQEEFFAFL